MDDMWFIIVLDWLEWKATITFANNLYLSRNVYNIRKRMEYWSQIDI